MLLLVGLMAVNYPLNVLVIGLPVIKMGAPRANVVRDLIGFTVLGQVADRLGAIIGPVISFLVLELLHIGGERELGLGFSIGFVPNLILAGVFVALLVCRYMRRRWSLRGRRVTVMACVAAVLTNPFWGAAVAMTVTGLR